MSFTGVCFFFAPKWKSLINNYLYTVQLTIWSKERVFKIWLIKFLVKALYDFFLAWTHLISSERIYIYWSQFDKLGYKLVILGKTGLQIAHSNKDLMFEALLVSDCHKSNWGISSTSGAARLFLYFCWRVDIFLLVFKKRQ